MTTKWVPDKTDRGFYKGSTTNNAWANDLNWRQVIQKEDKQAKMREMLEQEGRTRPSSRASAAQSISTASTSVSSLDPDLLRHIQSLPHHQQGQAYLSALRNEKRERKRREKEFVSMMLEERAMHAAMKEEMRELKNQLAVVSNSLDHSKLSGSPYLQRCRVPVGTQKLLLTAEMPRGTTGGPRSPLPRRATSSMN